MVIVSPKPERGKYLILVVNDSVPISTVVRLVVNGQCRKAIGSGGIRLRSEITEKLCAVVDKSVASRQGKKGITRCCDGPAQSHWMSVTSYVKQDSICGGGQMITISCCINNDRTAIRRITATTATTS